MSELIISQALKTVIENSLIPELEKKLKHYETTNKKLLKLVKELSVDKELICYKCISVITNNYAHCRVCYKAICGNCFPNVINMYKCPGCETSVHKKCSKKSDAKLSNCGHCLVCYCDC